MAPERTDNCRIAPVIERSEPIMIKTWPRMAFVKSLQRAYLEDPPTDECCSCAVRSPRSGSSLCVFPDVIFMHASLSNASLVNVTSDDGHKRVQLFPERKVRQAYEGFYDAGGGAFQSEPAAQFVRRSLQAGQSIYWNPYSATGSYGPETLVDIKTSPVSMVNAVLNGGDLTSHIVFLGFNLLAVFCLLVLFTIEFRLSFVAALAGGVTFLLNGYYVANLGSNVSQVWLYFPVLTLALVSFARRPGTLKLVGISLARNIGTGDDVPADNAAALGNRVAGRGGRIGRIFAGAQEQGLRPVSGAAARLMAGQLAGVSLGLLTLAILYFLIAEALQYMATGDLYAARQFYPAYLFNLISLFTPKHAFEAYNAITAARRSDARQCSVPSGNYRRPARKPGRAAVANPSANRHWCRGRRAPGVRCANLWPARCHPDCGCASRPGKPWRAVSLDQRRSALHDHRSVWPARLAGQRAKAAPVAGHHGRDRIGARVHDDIVRPGERHLRRYLWVAVSILAAGVALIISKPTRPRSDRRRAMSRCSFVGRTHILCGSRQTAEIRPLFQSGAFCPLPAKADRALSGCELWPVGRSAGIRQCFWSVPDRVDELSTVPALCRSFQPPDSARSDPTLDLLRHPGAGARRRFAQSSQFRFSWCEISADAIVICASSQLHGETLGLAKGL